MIESFHQEAQDFPISDLRKPTLETLHIWPCVGRSSSSSRASSSCSRAFLCLSLLCWAGGLWGHPQCLDYGPPFQPPLHLEFCSSYENFGCCDQQRDSSIAARYREIMDSMDPQGHALCGTYIKDILCQVGWKISTHILCFWLILESVVVLVASRS